MLLLVLSFAVADIADPQGVAAGGVGDSTGQSTGRNTDDRVVDVDTPMSAAPWQVFGVAAGLSLATSVLLAVPLLVVLPVFTLISLAALTAGAPIVSGAGLSRIDSRVEPVVGLVVGDIIGLIVGVAGGLLAFEATVAGGLSRSCADNPDDCIFSDWLIGGLAFAVGGAWLGRALGSGTGATIGSLLATDPLPSL